MEKKFHASFGGAINWSYDKLVKHHNIILARKCDCANCESDLEEIELELQAIADDDYDRRFVESNNDDY